MNDSERTQTEYVGGSKSPLIPPGGAKQLMEEARDYLSAAQRAVSDLGRSNDAGESAGLDQELYIDTISCLLILLDNKMNCAYEDLLRSPEP
ncbi:MAG TPA: hypothetical protein PLZ95_20860 [Bryobacteraceae bacterium]|nr:hypothetical protein [Bryobacteraceae bacterium]